MSRVTSKLQVTIPKAIATRHGIEPGTEVEWLTAGEAIRVVPQGDQPRSADPDRRLELFDRATERQRLRSSGRKPASSGRGWSRDELYGRGSAR